MSAGQDTGSVVGGFLLGPSPLSPTERVVPAKGGKSTMASSPGWQSQRLLTEPADLVWRPIARAIMSQGEGLGLAEPLFLMDLSAHKLCSLPKFYHGMFTVWGMFHRQRLKNCVFLSLLLKEPVRFINHLLNTLKCELTETELSLLNALCNRHCQPNGDNPFPVLTLVPDFKDYTGLQSHKTPTSRLNVMGGKTIYKLTLLGVLI